MRRGGKAADERAPGKRGVLRVYLTFEVYLLTRCLRLCWH